MKNGLNNKNIKNNDTHIVKYNHELDNTISLHVLNSKEIDLFNAICIKIRDSGTSTVDISFEDLKELSDYKNKNTDKFFEDIKNSCQKISITQFVVESETRVTNINLFSFYDLNEENKKLSVKMNEDFLYFFNNLKDNFSTVFDIKTSNKLKSKYAKIQYRIIRKHLDKGEYEETFVDFKKRMGLTDVKIGNINKGVITPIEKTFSNIFDNFQLIKEKKGKQIDKLKWVWTESKDDPFEFFNSIFKFINVNFTHKIQLKIHELQKEKSKEETEDLIDKAWKLIKNNSKVKNPPALLSKAITDIGLETFINNSMEMEHKIQSNKESAERERKWTKEKQEHANIAKESEEFYSQIFKSAETTNTSNSTNEIAIQRDEQENKNQFKEFREEFPFFNEFQELPIEKQEEIFTNAKKIYIDKTGLELWGNMDSAIAIGTLMPYIKELMNNKQ